MNMMKTSLTEIPMCPRERFTSYKSFPGLSLATKGIGPLFRTVVTIVTCYLLRIILSHNYLLPIISVLAKNTLLKTTCQILLLLVGFDTLTYRKDYDRSPILVGHHFLILSWSSRLLKLWESQVDNFMQWYLQDMIEFWPVSHTNCDIDT